MRVADGDDSTVEGEEDSVQCFFVFFCILLLLVDIFRPFTNTYKYKIAVLSVCPKEEEEVII